jgi:hypothetical protein
MSETLARDFYGDALAWGRKKYPDSPEQHHIGFAWIIAFACGDKSVKRAENPGTIRVEYGVTLIYSSKQPGQFTFEEAIKLLEIVCYGSITKKHADIYYKQGILEGDYLEDISAAKLILKKRQGISPCVIDVDREVN